MKQSILQPFQKKTDRVITSPTLEDKRSKNGMQQFQQYSRTKIICFLSKANQKRKEQIQKHVRFKAICLAILIRN